MLWRKGGGGGGEEGRKRGKLTNPKNVEYRLDYDWVTLCEHTYFTNQTYFLVNTFLACSRSAPHVTKLF